LIVTPDLSTTEAAPEIWISFIGATARNFVMAPAITGIHADIATGRSGYQRRGIWDNYDIVWGDIIIRIPRRHGNAIQP
jgi:hypothetical protein